MTVDVVELPATITPGEGGEVTMPKLPVMANVTLALWTIDPAVPVIVTV